jgi:2-C-methyl-D-erythritol 4-phosphate cytidylyltransferase/2-C-methyl-D-erythritol 2,4-cyclodiphosphate synthase
MKIYAILPAAGRGARFGSAENKVLRPIGGIPIVTRTALAFGSLVDSIIVASRENELDAIRDAILPYWSPNLAELTFAAGGETRQDSVRNALITLNSDDDSIVLVHDAARPLVSPGIIRRCIESAKAYGSGVAAIPVFDTLKRADNRAVIVSSVERENCWSMQTPQTFRLDLLRAASDKAQTDGFQGTDEASIVDRIAIEGVRLVLGSRENIKITTPDDFEFAQRWLNGSTLPDIRVGFGYDIHRLVPGRQLWLGGVQFDYSLGLDGHSDADVVLHAICDALLGAAGLPDIGVLFPNTDDSYKGASSVALLEVVRTRIGQEGFAVNNVDCTLIAEKPKISGKSAQMRQIIADSLHIDMHRVNVKATTQEKIGALGAGEGIACHATACLARNFGGEQTRIVAE